MEEVQEKPDKKLCRLLKIIYLKENQFQVEDGKSTDVY